MINFMKVRILEYSRIFIVFYNEMECDYENIVWLKDLLNKYNFFFIRMCFKFVDIFCDDKWVLEYVI